ncbi:MAG: serine/threonine-protein kinase [Myxococcota bacterium]
MPSLDDDRLAWAEASDTDEADPDAATLRTDADEDMLDRVRQRLFAPKPIATQIGRFVVLEELGHGAMGTVYAAYDERLDRKAAIKVMRSEQLLAEDSRQRFIREAQALARLSHPNVVAIHEVGDHDGELFLAMEFIRGQTVGDWLKTEPAWEDVLNGFAQAGRGLSAVHRAGLIHRDLKPHNLMRSDDGVVKLLDFGLVRAADELEEEFSEPESLVSGSALTSSLTAQGMVMGTPVYMSPEQMEGTEIEASSDQYSFCAALWEGLCGARPFENGDDFRSLFQAKVRDTPRWPADAPPVPRVIVEALQRGLSVDPNERWPSMDALLGVLSSESRRRLWLLPATFAGLGGIAVGAVAWPVALEAPAPCAEMERHLEGIWDEPRREAVRDAFAKTELDYVDHTLGQVLPALDEHAQTWVEQRQQACEATRVRGEQSDELLDLRMACYDGVLQTIQATVDVLTEADEATVQNAVDRVNVPLEFARCADAEALRAQSPLPEDPQVVEAITLVSAQLERVEALASLGKKVEARELLEKAAAEAETLGYAPLEISADAQRALNFEKAGDFESATAAGKRAVYAAMRERQFALAMSVANTLINVVGVRVGDLDRGRDLAALSEALDPGTEPYQEAIRLSHLCALENKANRYGEAQEHCERALAILEEEYGPDHLLVSVVLLDLGAVLLPQGHIAEASQMFERSLAIAERTRGPTHPLTINALAHYANVLREQHRLAEARPIAKRVYDVRRATYGRRHYLTANILVLGALVDGQLGEHEKALEKYQEVASVYEEKLKPDHPELAFAYLDLAETLESLGRCAESSQPYERAIAILETDEDNRAIHLASALSGAARCDLLMGRAQRALERSQRSQNIHERIEFPDPWYSAPAFISVGRSLIALERPAEAIEPLERAQNMIIESVSKAESRRDPGRLGRTRIALAQALWDAPPPQRDRAHAITLARQGKEGLRESWNISSVELGLADQWLATHRLDDHDSGTVDAPVPPVGP